MKINIYTCQHGHETITRDTPTRKVTPYQITCPQCKLPAVSSNYKVDQNLKPEYEWFLPKTAKEWKEACLPIYGDVFSESEYDLMVDGKSLMYRKIK